MTTEPASEYAADTAVMRAQWDRMAKGWSDSGIVIRPWLHEATQAMLGMAGVQPGARVIDVAAGAAHSAATARRRRVVAQ